MTETAVPLEAATMPVTLKIWRYDSSTGER